MERSDIGEYGDFLLEFDASIGRVLDAIDDKGIRDNTLVLFSSDNGGVVEYRPIDYASIEGHFPNSPLRGQKTDVYEGGIEFHCSPDGPAKFRREPKRIRLIALTDMLATFAELFDHTLPANSAEDSVSCLSSMIGARANRGQRQSLVCDSFTGMMSIRSGHWKLIQGQHGGGARTQNQTYDQDLPPVQLYDFSNDIREENNVSKQHPAKVSELTKLLLQTIARPSRKAV